MFRCRGFLLPTLTLLLLHPISLAANVEPAETRLSFKPLDLNHPPTDLELVAAGQLGGPLTLTHDIEDPERKERINLSFGQAIQAWNAHEYPRAVGLFHRHLEDFPDSPWASEAELHLGCDAQYQGRYHEAREHYAAILATHLGEDHPGARMMVNKTRLRLGGLEVLEYDFDAAAEQFRILKEESPDWRHRTYAAHWLQRLSRYRGAEAELMSCGLQALAHLLELNDHSVEARSVRQTVPVSKTGHSLEQLLTLAARSGVELEARRIRPHELPSLPLPAIVQLQRKSDASVGHYWVVESIERGRIRIHDPQSTRTFDQNLEEFSREWQGVVVIPAGSPDLPGRPLQPGELEDLRGGCCGAPAPETGLGSPGSNGGPDDPGDPCGGPRWDVNMLNMNFHVTDVPMWYRPAYGPMVRFQLSYNSQSAIAYHEPFGPKWQFNYASYAVVDTGGAVLIFMPDGRRDQYTPSGLQTFTAPFGVYHELVNVGTDAYELRLTDGMTYVYARPIDIQGEPLTQILLTEMRDAYGQNLSFAYDGAGQMVSVTDALGQVSTLTYDGSSRISGIADPFGRSVTLTYDPDGNLASITDMGGYASSFTYDVDRYITSIDGARGRWEFYTEPSGASSNGASDRYPPPGTPMWANYRITVTNPLGRRYEYFWYGGCESGFGCRGTSWYVSPRDYVKYRSQTHNTYNLQVPRTRYVPFDHASGRGEIARIITPEGRDWNFAYDAAGNVNEFVDSHGHTTRFTYNPLGQVTSKTDPLDITTDYIYAPNGLDVIEIRDVLGTTYFEYNTARDVTAVTDRLGKRTEFTYNGLGQLTGWKDPLQVSTALTYGTGADPKSATRNGVTLFDRTFDGPGRIATHTDSVGVSVALTYDDLDRLSRATYPDTLFESYSYSAACLQRLETRTERSGLATNFLHDELSRVVEIRHADGTRSMRAYDANGNVVTRTDRSGHETHFEWDLDNRVARRTFADNNTEQFTWDPEGVLATRTNGRGTTITYGYDERHDLTGVTFGDSTPSVSYSRDDAGRVDQRDDALGTTTLAYDLESRLTGIDGPWGADNVTMQYDDVGRMTEVAVAGGLAMTYTYDDHGRPEQIKHGTSAFDYTYTGASPVADSRTAPNGVTTTYLYDALNRLEEISHRLSGGALVSRNEFTYNTRGQRASEILERALAPDPRNERLRTATYSASDQLLTDTDPTRTYSYDDDGNLLQGYVTAGHPFAATYDAENHLQTVEWTDGTGHVHRRENTYDGNGWLGRTIERLDGIVQRDRRFLRGPRRILQERDASNTVVADYAWEYDHPGGIGGLLLRRAGGLEHVYLHDGKGNVSEVLDASATVVAAYDYDSFGAISKETGTLDQDFRFSTKPFDPGTGLSEFGYRFYSPAMARWLTRDPLREAGGTNLYAFVGGDPLNEIDPWGLEPNSSSEPGPTSDDYEPPGSYGRGQEDRTNGACVPDPRYDDLNGICEPAPPSRRGRGCKHWVKSRWRELNQMLGTQDRSWAEDESGTNVAVGVRD